MKKNLLLLFVFVQFSVFSQVPDLVNCQGTALFDLTSQESILIGTQNPTDIVISYHTTLVDAQNNTNAIANPSSYSSIVSPEIIFARVENTETTSTTIENFDLIVNSPIVVSNIVSSFTCATGGTISFDVSGGASGYLVSLFNAINNTVVLGPSTSTTITGLNEGIYIVQVLDSLGCLTQFQVEIINPNPISVTAVLTSNDCINKGIITITATGGSGDYLYSIGGVGYQNSNIFTNLVIGTNDFQIKDSNGCIAFFTVTIDPPLPLDILVSVNICQGDEVVVTATGSPGPYQYSIDNGVTFQSSNVFSNLIPGVTYTFMVTNALGCSAFQVISIDVFNPLQATAAVNGNTVTLNVTGGSPPYTFMVSPYFGQIFANNVFTNLPTGFICFNVQDFNGCSASPICLEIVGPLSLQSNGTYQDFNNDGYVNIGDIINYNFTVNNTGSLDATTITLDSFGLPNNGATIATLIGSASDNSTFTASYVLTQQDITNGYVTKDFQVNGTYDGNPTSTITTNTTTLSISDGIKLNAFLDSNGNNIQDNGEQNINVGSFEYQINNGNTVSIVSSTGTHYLYETNPANTYNLSYVIDSANANQYTLSQSNYSNVTVATNSGITTYNFPLTIIPYVDLQVYLNQNGFAPRPGFTYTERIMYRNVGNQTTSGTITFTNNNVVAITSVSESGITSNANGFTYNFTNLLPNETRYIYVTMQTPVIPTVALGQVLTNTVTITIPSGDVNVNNNESTLSQVIVGSYDPNDKAEVHGGKIVHADFSSNDYLTYTIQFENTGTASAITVKVDDVLDAMLDVSTLKMIDASHDYVLERNGNNLSWKFNGIDLPPSVENTQIGKGYIIFQIKPTAGYALGDIIPNTAYIYFDFNPAIITNTHTTEFVAPLSNPSFVKNVFLVYPNPMNNEVFVTSKNNTIIESLNITDVLGKTIYNENANTTSTQLDVSGFQKGIYFLRVKSNGSEEVIKMIKQ